LGRVGGARRELGARSAGLTPLKGGMTNPAKAVPAESDKVNASRSRRVADGDGQGMGTSFDIMALANCKLGPSQKTDTLWRADLMK